MASKYLQKFRVPQIFPQVLHDYARQVLRNQPQDIIDFSIGYFTALQSGQEFDYPNKGEKIPPPKKARLAYDEEGQENQVEGSGAQAGQEMQRGSAVEAQSYAEQLYNQAQLYRKTPSVQKMQEQAEN